MFDRVLNTPLKKRELARSQIVLEILCIDAILPPYLPMVCNGKQWYFSTFI